MNVQKIKNDKYIHRYEGYWNRQKDVIGTKYPIPKHNKNIWTGQYLFAQKLLKLQFTLNRQKNFESINENCEICNIENITTREYSYKRTHWKDGIVHYILEHNYKPTSEFMEFILGHYVSLTKTHVRLPSIIYQKRSNNKKYIKIDKNQLQILDALMVNGGYTKKYKTNNGKYKYSEHSGFFVIENGNLDKIVVDSNIQRINDSDPEVFLPSNMIEAYDCEYIFHTHPPTPEPSSRRANGIMYELPSANDIAHFIIHSNFGVTRGSIVISPEGLYIIRRINDKYKYIYLDQSNLEQFLNNVQTIQYAIQEKSIRENKDFSIEKYYNKIIQDKTFLNPLNDYLKQYNIKIDYYPRKLNSKNQWVIDDIYLQI